ncbi:MAG TPA: thioredoxin family protein, partial [Armatimonadota bacterium]|nr:thioredoxin family protein [Armatimonadota bacterium]
ALLEAKVVALPEGVLIRAGEITITQKDLDAEIAKTPENFREQVKASPFFLVEAMATGKIMTAEAKAWAKKTERKDDETDQQIINAYLQNLTDKLSVSDDEAKTFFDQNTELMGTATYDQIKDQIKEYLLDQKRQDTINAHIKSVGTRTVVEVDKDWAAKQYASEMKNPINIARKSGKPTLVDFGADGCKPCEMMAPILDELREEYGEKLNIVFIQVEKDPVIAARFGIQAVPVQVFYDKNGKEVFTHVGFFDKESIVSKLKEMGVN